jgi:hydroxymethylglutaryl-CoA reductase
MSGLYKLSLAERQQRVAEYAGLDQNELDVLSDSLALPQAEAMIENVVGRYALPLGLATNFVIKGREVVVPMVVEEPSIIAGVSFAAKLVRSGGGFRTSSSEPMMIGQIQLLDLPDLDEAIRLIKAEEVDLLVSANRHHPTIQRLGGGAKRIEYRPFGESPVGPMLIVHILYDCRDAMGANAVNTAAEAVAPLLEQIRGGRANLRILSNLTDQRTARAECLVPVEQLSKNDLSGQQVAQAIFEAWALAAVDPARAATHNKGVMNGIDAVAVATGNDWRALEAGAHAFAARSGRYTSLTEWSLVTTAAGQISLVGYEGATAATHLRGVLNMPLSIGTVGGTTTAHPTARVSMKILRNPNARTLAEIMVSVGLAQNLAAIRALASEGIQRGHMRLHARQVALAAGAEGDQVQEIADILVTEGNIRQERARELVESQVLEQ